MRLWTKTLAVFHLQLISKSTTLRHRCRCAREHNRFLVQRLRSLRVHEQRATNQNSRTSQAGKAHGVHASDNAGLCRARAIGQRFVRRAPAS
ncbi:hypothetical protein C8J57DRAFT_1329765 [Mycena rebaudengoi]|nr:hypothetical protein C8J57DRAFT_1329765 [Mycena rebaudengoi]